MPGRATSDDGDVYAFLPSRCDRVDDALVSSLSALGEGNMGRCGVRALR